MSKILGVDINARNIRLALVKNGKKPKLLNCVEIPIPHNCLDTEGYFINDDLDLTLKETIKKNKLSSGKVAVCIRNAMVREFDFEGIKDKEIKNALELELSATIKDIAVSYQVNYRIYERTKTKVRGLVAFSPHKHIECALSYQEKLPGTIKYLDVYSNALVKAIKYTMKAEKTNSVLMVIDIGYKDSMITVIENNEVLLSRTVTSGAYHLDKLVSEEFSYPLEEVEAERKSYYKNYFERGIDMESFIRMAYQPVQMEALQAKNFYEKKQLAVESVLLIGEGIEVPSIDLYIRESFTLPVLTVNPTDAKGKFVEGYHKLLPAIGTAIRED